MVRRYSRRWSQPVETAPPSAAGVTKVREAQVRGLVVPQEALHGGGLWGWVGFEAAKNG